jgi:hypothetical protein
MEEQADKEKLKFPLSTTVGSMGISESQLPLLNKSATERDWHHLPAEAGGGVQAYFEGFHYIHCLVGLRPPVASSRYHTRRPLQKCKASF